jgi:hypothetical protein
VKASIRRFLQCIGNAPLSYDDVTPEALQKRLLKRIALKREELQEMEDALIAMDWVEVLDAVLDAKVYNIQDEIDLEESGFNVVEAGQDVCLNNELKYTEVASLSWQNFMDYLELNPEKNVYIDIAATPEGNPVWCLKNSKGKIVKPPSHPKVVLDIHVPYKFGGVKP